MMRNYYKQQILQPLEAGNLQDFKAIKHMLLDDIYSGDQVRLVTQDEGRTTDNVQLLTTPDEVHKWFQPYGF